jgi:hypothetical protein
MRDERPGERFKFWVHFVCGFLVGGFIGFWIFFDFESAGVIADTTVFALMFAVLAGIYLDDFWDRFMAWVGRWWWW